MRINLAKLEQQGFDVYHDQKAGTIDIHFRAQETGYDFHGMVDDIANHFDLPAMSRDILYGELVSTVEFETIRKFIK